MTAGMPAASRLPTNDDKLPPLSDPQAWGGNTGNAAWRVQVQHYSMTYDDPFVFLLLLMLLLLVSKMLRGGGSLSTTALS